MSQYSKEQSGFEFVQIDSENSKVLAAIKTCSRTYTSERAGDAAWAIANALDFKPGTHDKNDYSQLKFQAVPCGAYVALFNRDG